MSKVYEGQQFRPYFDRPHFVSTRNLKTSHLQSKEAGCAAGRVYALCPNREEGDNHGYCEYGGKIWKTPRDSVVTVDDT